MYTVRPKKYLGQHFLVDQNIAGKIVGSLDPESTDILEIGPGTGVLTKFLLQKPEVNLTLIEVDGESVGYLIENYPNIREKIFHEDFLKFNIEGYLPQKFSIIGNFPYNISSQIFFRVLELKDRVTEVVGMIQKEVAERISSPPGRKSYGILSVLIQAFYNIEYLFTVNEHVFVPPPKVKSAVIRLTRNQIERLECNQELFIKIVKSAFNQRRKMLRNSLKNICLNLPLQYAEKRPEQLSVQDFIQLTGLIESMSD